MNAHLVTYAVDGRVGIVSLNRPEKLNAITPELKRLLMERFHEADRDPATSVVVLRAEGRSFSAGYDIGPSPARAARRGNALAWHESLTDDVALEMTPWDMRKPVIASVQGHCLGGGCEMAMMCDVVIAADSAKFGQPEITIGTIPGSGGTQRLTRAVGKAKAMELCLTGRMMDAEEAERSGLVARVVPAAKLMEEALATAEKIASYSQPVVLMVKEAVNRAFETTLSEGVRFERRVFHATFALEDQKEGMSAFAEKRKPVWKHR